MTLRTLAPLATLALLAGITSSCSSGNCLDDGPVWQQNKCPAGSAENSNSNSDSDSDSASNGDSETDSASAPTEGSNSNSNSNSNSASATNTNTNTEATATETDVTATDSNTVSASNTVSDSNTDSASASDTDTDSASASDTNGGGTYCVDADGDGFGDPEQCTPVDRGDDPPPGTVPNDDDCDDGSVSTFPGAAPKDDPDACMTDADDDDYGDDEPTSPDAVPGSDCDDADADTFPGAAEEEANPDACMKDEDGDGWGDASVGDGVVGGLDCYDNLANFNPVDRVLFTTVDAVPGQIAEVDTASGDITPFAQLVPPLGTWNIFSAAVSPVDGRIYGHNSANTARRLVTFDYCDDGSEVTNLAMHGKSVCGLAFDNNGVLWGVNTTDNALITFDPDSGEITDSVDLEFMGDQPNLATCGMAYDCVHDRILVVDGTGSVIYDVDRETGVGTVVSNPMAGDWSSVGAEYDVVTDRMWVIDGALNTNDFFDVSLDGSNMSVKLPDISQAANDLTYGPACQ